MPSIFIARQITFFDHFQYRVDEEAVFDSFDESIDYLRSLSDYDAEINTSDLRNEIIEYQLGDREPWARQKQWIYKLDGTLHEFKDGSAESPRDWDIMEVSGLHRPGDIVTVKRNFDHPRSPFWKQAFGVVMEKPINKERWLSMGNDEDSWDGQYVIGFITDEGYFSHVHVPEGCLDVLSEPLPERLLFLEHAARWLRNPDESPETAKAGEGMSGDLFVLNIPTYF